MTKFKFDLRIKRNYKMSASKEKKPRKYEKVNIPLSIVKVERVQRYRKGTFSKYRKEGFNT